MLAQLLLSAIVGTVRGAAVFSLEPFTVRFENVSSCFLSVTHRDEPDRPLLVAGDEKGTPFLQAARTAPREPPITSDGGYNCGFKHGAPFEKCELVKWTSAVQTAGVVKSSATAIIIEGELRGAGDVHTTYQLALSVGHGDEPDDPPFLRVSAALLAPAPAATNNANRLTLLLRSESKERLIGFGQQYSKWDQKGEALPMLVSEQGIGRGLEPLTTAVNLFGGKTGGNSWTTCEYSGARRRRLCLPADAPLPLLVPTPLPANRWACTAVRGGDAGDDLQRRRE